MMATHEDGGRKLKILIVDDDQDFCASLTALLTAQGFAVSVAHNGKEGLNQAMAQPPDLIVLDIMMEHSWAGYEVNQAIKFAPGNEAMRNVPILMVSSVPIDPASRFAHATEAEMVTPDLYLTKPIDIPRFLEAVRSLVSRPAPPADK
jgi:DNA-binding response OmpR family regulator